MPGQPPDNVTQINRPPRSCVQLMNEVAGMLERGELESMVIVTISRDGRPFYGVGVDDDRGASAVALLGALEVAKYEVLADLGDDE